jgi:alanine racemase
MFSNWVEVDLSAISNNVRLICQLTGVDVMAVIKANGYGHGAIPVAKSALSAGATWCGVARIDEAIELRQHLDNPILVLGFTPPGRYTDAIQNDITLAVWNGRQIQHAAGVARKLNRISKLHLKIDTGMSRLGALPEESTRLAGEIRTYSSLDFNGIFTHFACADEVDQSSMENQLSSFNEIIKELGLKGLQPPLVHAANSAATLRRSDTHFNMVRTGIAIYGMHPSKDCQLPAEFQPVLSWKSVISQIKILPGGRGVSYGHRYHTTGNERIGTIPVGYADGFRRESGNEVLISGKRVPVIGRVCMDQIIVQLDAVPEAKEGDEVILIGRQGDQQITAEEVGDRWGTINYEVTCGLSARVTRIYT